MTREEAIDKLRRLCSPEQMYALKILVPELAVSEDERIRKNLIELLLDTSAQDIISHHLELSGVLAWIEKQKQYDIDVLEKRITRDSVSELPQAVIIRNGKERAGRPAGNNNNPGGVNQYSRGQSAGQSKGQSAGQSAGQSTPQSVGQSTPQSAGQTNRNRSRNKKIIVEANEQKPILEVFGFKVGDAVRLKDGDGRKHIIKSFKEVKGLNGPNFYHVEFEDNSARDSIYPGKQYLKGYYTQMEKFEEEQKPKEKSEKPIIPEWSEEDKRKLNRIYAILGQAADTHAFSTTCRLIGDKEAVELQDFLRSIAKPKSGEWSEEDEEMYELFSYVIELAEDCPDKEKVKNWIKEIKGRFINSDYRSVGLHYILKNNHKYWKPSEEQMNVLKEAIFYFGNSWVSHKQEVLESIYNDLKSL